MISLDSIVAISPDQVSCELGGEAVILNLKKGAYYGLDEVGATIWSLIAEPVAVSKILETLLERYEVERGRCRDDLLALLAELRERGLIRIGDAGSN
jgi:Coenzyme PQQ synthesis protein D (PqqD)